MDKNILIDNLKNNNIDEIIKAYELELEKIKSEFPENLV
jgi:hypothetical protein